MHKQRFDSITTYLLLVLVGCSLASPYALAGHTLQVGAATVCLEPWNRGMSLSVYGLPVIKGSNMVVTRPPWSPHYYLGPSQETINSAVVEELPKGKRLTMTHRSEHDYFVAQDVVTITDDLLVERVFTGTFSKESDEALIQWEMGAINPALIIGKPFKATLVNGETVTGTVPIIADHVEVDPSTLARDFSTIEFESRIGKISISIDTKQHTHCYDYRRNRWSRPENPFFWLGDSGSRFRPGESISYHIKIQLPNDIEPREGLKTQSQCAKLIANSHVQSPNMEEDPLIIPRPKKAGYSTGRWRLPKSGGESSSTYPVPAEAIKASRLLREFLKGDFGYNVDEGAEGEETLPKAISMRTAGDNWEMAIGGYTVVVSDEGIVVEAKQESGFINAVQTIKQLAGISAEGDVVVRHASISDWPALGFRGVHLFTGGKGNALHLELINKVISALKMNHLVLEAEYVQWDSHPELHHRAYGMAKQDVLQIVRRCADLGLEVTPLVMSLGHCQWMFETGHNLDLAEDPEAKWAYCVTNPDTYKFIYEIYEEAIELFKPRYFHIGHDEFHHRGEVPHRESSKPYTVEQLFTMDTLRHWEWFKDRGIKVMMWGDMLLGKGEGPDACHAASTESAAELRQAIPHDVVIADWHYVDTEPSGYGNLGVFRNDGFSTIASTWNRPGNITNFAKAAYEAKSWGLLQTTWAGYSLDPDSFKNNVQQYAAYVLAAESAWNADNPPDPSSYPYEEYFFDLMGMSAIHPASRSGWVADLASVYNYAASARTSADWFGMGSEYDLSGIPQGDRILKGISFRFGVEGPDRANRVITASSRIAFGLDLPDAVEIKLGKPAARLVIVHATNFPHVVGAKTGEYVLTYADGQTHTVDLVYGKNILAYESGNAIPAAPAVWRGRTRSGQTVTLRAFVLDNPRPEAAIAGLTLRSAGSAVSPLVFAITGIEE